MQDDNVNPQGDAQMSDDLKEKLEQAAANAEASMQEEAQTANANDVNEELKGQLARALADLQNYKRRSEEEKASFVKYANAELLKQLLPVFDHLNLSIHHLPENIKDNEWAKGVVQINAELLKTLEGMGIQRIETVGKPLDPNLHEALMQGPGEQNVIIEEFEPGYTLNGTVVKPAKVKVGNGE